MRAVVICRRHLSRAPLNHGQDALRGCIGEEREHTRERERETKETNKGLLYLRRGFRERAEAFLIFPDKGVDLSALSRADTCDLVNREAPAPG